MVRANGRRTGASGLINGLGAGPGALTVAAAAGTASALARGAAAALATGFIATGLGRLASGLGACLAGFGVIFARPSFGAAFFAAGALLRFFGDGFADFFTGLLDFFAGMMFFRLFTRERAIIPTRAALYRSRQRDLRWGAPARFSVLDDHGGVDTAAHVEYRVQAHKSWRKRRHQVLQDGIADGLMKHPAVAE